MKMNGLAVGALPVAANSKGPESGWPVAENVCPLARSVKRAVLTDRVSALCPIVFPVTPPSLPAAK